MLGSVNTRAIGNVSATVVALAMGALLALGAPGCAPQGLGDPCTPEAIPNGGFAKQEVYVESGSVQCRTRTCMVFHLAGNPECTPDCAACGQGGTALCPRCTGAPAACVVTGNAADEKSDERVFCSCRCSAGGNPALPLCRCTTGFRCVPDGDPGGGYCVPNEVAINPPAGTLGICENTSECLMGMTCDPASRHCL